jgi:GNAT superfamily N-acetyltransferase
VALLSVEKDQEIVYGWSSRSSPSLTISASTAVAKNGAGSVAAMASLRLNEPMSVKLTPAKVQKFEAHIRKCYEGVFFELMVTHSLLARNVIELIWIIVQDRKQGVGTAIMRELCEFADRHAAQIRLTPASKGDNAATTSRARLIRFYKRFGFGIDKRKAGDIISIPALIRKPVV